MLAVTEDKTRPCFQRKDRHTEMLDSLILIKVYHGNHSSPQNTNKYCLHMQKPSPKSAKMLLVAAKVLSCGF